MKYIRTVLVWLTLSLAPAFRAEAATDRVMAPAADVSDGHFIRANALDLKQILPPPPAPDSLAGRADLATVLHVQDSRTAGQVAWAKFVEEDDLFKNARVLGPWFTRENLPQTAKFFGEVDDDGFVISRLAKAMYPRPRPPLTDSRVKPCVEVPASGSYPSGHSSQAWMCADLLVQIFPEKRAELLERASAVEWARVIGGAHFPTDTEGGRRLGEAIAREILKNPAARAEIEKCRAEAQPFLLKKAA